MSEDNKAMVDRMVEAINTDNMDVMEVDEVYFLRVEDGKFVDFWALEDDLARMRQLGLIPSPEQWEEVSPT